MILGGYAHGYPTHDVYLVMDRRLGGGAKQEMVSFRSCMRESCGKVGMEITRLGRIFLFPFWLAGVSFSFASSPHGHPDGDPYGLPTWVSM